MPPAPQTRDARTDSRSASILRFAPLLLAVSVAARMAWVLLSPNGMNLVDLHVYVDGSAALLSDNLYDFTYAELTPDFPLPFTYPPFAALVFSRCTICPSRWWGCAGRCSPSQRCSW
jgi:alpha-1,2-mannosyltransferase